MNTNNLMTEDSLHLWHVFMPDFITEIDALSRLLSAEELQRANRFYFERHRQRYIIARGMLRRILSRYIDMQPQDFIFSVGSRGKPFLQGHPLYFNVSHSGDMAVYALTRQHEVGVDIEKIKPDYDDAVAKRFFSEKEYQQLSALPIAEKKAGFYRIWTAKEALIKALGEGLFVPLADFDVDLAAKTQLVSIRHQQQEHCYYLAYFNVHAEYQSAFAVEHSMINLYRYKIFSLRVFSAHPNFDN